MTWSAKQYAIFEDERTRPVRDLLAAVPDIDARRVIDLGCGPGNSTERLAARFPRATLSGLDSSADMITAARSRLPDVQFDIADIADLTSWSAPGPFDVILANAVMQWVPDHAHLFPALVGKLAPGGALALQMPDNQDQPTHRLMREIAAGGPWAGKIAVSRTPIAAADWYYALLRGVCERVDIWRTTYLHPLAGGVEAVVEWVKGSGLRPFLEPLDDVERQVFLERYRAAIAAAYPAQPDGTVLLPFPRLFIVAVRSR